MRDVKGYEGLYAVTSCGKVWSYRKSKFLKTFNQILKMFCVGEIKQQKAIILNIFRDKAEDKTSAFCLKKSLWTYTLLGFIIQV